MRTALVGLFLLVPAAALAAGDDCCDDTWVEFKPKNGRFTVKLPGKPKNVSQDIDYGGGTTRNNMWAYEVSPTAAYLVSWIEYPDGVVDPDNHAELLDAWAKRVVGQGKQLASKPVKLQKKYAGREVSFTVPAAKATARIRGFYVGNRLYQVMALGDAEFMAGDDINKYFASFKLLD